MDYNSKFVLYDFNGLPLQHYGVRTLERVNEEHAPIRPPLAHHIIVVDRSGSMGNDIEPLKNMLVKLLTLDEYQNGEHLASLISYSSHGDCTMHFQRVPVRRIMQFDSKERNEIQRIHAGGLTGISQALRLAREIVREGEFTGISLHSDGYANDPSPHHEHQEIDRFCEEKRGQNLFVNTLAYRGSSDFPFLSHLANSLSGKCVRADNVRDVYDALHDAAQTLDGSVVPPVTYRPGDAEYQVFVSRSTERLNASSSSLTVAGLRPQDDGTLYRYHPMTEPEYARCSAKVEQGSDAVYGMALGYLAEGNLNRAKYALVSTCHTPLARRHARALAGPQLAAFSEDLQHVLWGRQQRVIDTAPVNFGAQSSLLDLIAVLESNREQILLNLHHLQQNYRRRGLRRVFGVRDAQGRLEEPWLKTEYTDPGDYVPMGRFEVNRNSANINLGVQRPCRLVKTADASPVSTVAGLSVSHLTDYHSYTVVGDGEPTLPEMKITIATPAALAAIQRLGLLAGETFSLAREYSLPWASLPVVRLDFGGRVPQVGSVFNVLAGLRAVAGILASLTKEASGEYTAEQMQELKRHYLSKSLYLNFPTTTEYDDLHKAIADGSVDVRVGYQVDIGSRQILNLGKLPSANAFLDRMFEVHERNTGREAIKATWADFGKPSYSYHPRKVSARMKITAVDNLLRPIVADFLGLENNGSVQTVLSSAHIFKPVSGLLAGGHAVLSRAKEQVEAQMEAVYREEVIPLTFYIGATGLLPDAFPARAETSEQVEQRYPDLKFSREEREGRFFEVGDGIVSVHARREYYSTGKTN